MTKPLTRSLKGIVESKVCGRNCRTQPLRDRKKDVAACQVFFIYSIFFVLKYFLFSINIIIKSKNQHIESKISRDVKNKWKSQYKFIKLALELTENKNVALLSL